MFDVNYFVLCRMFTKIFLESVPEVVFMFSDCHLLLFMKKIFIECIQ